MADQTLAQAGTVKRMRQDWKTLGRPLKGLALGIFRLAHGRGPSIRRLACSPAFFTSEKAEYGQYETGDGHLQWLFRLNRLSQECGQVQGDLPWVSSKG